MRKLIIFSLVTFTLQNISGQLLEKRLQPFNFSSSQTAEYFNNHIYLGLSENTSYKSEWHSTYIYKLNLNLEVIDSINLSTALNLDTTLAEISCIKHTPNNTIVLTVNERYLLNGYGWMVGHLVELDSNLNIIIHGCLKSDSTGSNFLSVLPENDRFIVTGMEIYPFNLSNPSYIRNPGLIAILDSSANISKKTVLDTALISYNTLNQYRDLQDVIRYNNLYITTFGVYGNLKIGDIAIFSDSLEYISHKYLSNSAPFVEVSSTLITPPGNAPPLLYGMFSQEDSFNNFFHNPGILQLSTSGGSDTVFTFPVADTSFYDLTNFVQFTTGNIDYINFDSLNFANSSFFYDAVTYNFKSPNQVYIYNWNGNARSTNWQQVYSNGYINNLEEVVSLPRNRSLYLFNEVNWDKQPSENMAVHLMILDGQGNIVGSKENIINHTHIEFYPNPSTEIIYINGLESNRSYTFQIYNIDGKLVLQGKLLNQNQINVSLINSGNYILNLFSASTGLGISTNVIIK